MGAKVSHDFPQKKLFEGKLKRSVVETQPTLLVRRGLGYDEFKGVERRPRIAVRKPDETPTGFRRQLNRPPAEPPLGIRHSPVQDGPQRLVRKRVQADNEGPGEQGRNDLEGRIFRRGAQQHNRPVLHRREKGVLLGFVEAMDLVDEQDGPPAMELTLLPRLVDEAA